MALPFALIPLLLTSSWRPKPQSLAEMNFLTSHRFPVLLILGLLVSFVMLKMGPSGDVFKAKIETETWPTNTTLFGVNAGGWNLDYSDTVYCAYQKFSAGVPTTNHSYFLAFALLTWVAWMGLLTLATHLRSIPYFVCAGLTILFIAQIGLDQVISAGGFSFRTLVLMILSVGVSWLVFTRERKIPFLQRWMLITIPAAGFLGWNLWNEPSLLFHYAASAHTPLLLLCVLIMLLTAEEPIVLFLLAAGKARKGSQPRIFLALSVAYLGLLILYLLHFFGYSSIDMPEALLSFLGIGSVGIAMATFSKRRLPSWMTGQGSPDFRTPLFFMLLLLFGFFAMSLVTGNRVSGESLDDVILFAHFGLGFMMVIYVVINFFEILLQGFRVDRILFKPNALPYSNSKLAGIIIAVAFFLLSSNHAVRQARSGALNYRGIGFLKEGSLILAREYFVDSDRQAWHNHCANYYLGHLTLMDGDLVQARKHFEKASLRRSSGMAALSLADVLLSGGLPGQGVQVLKDALSERPASYELATNLSVELLRAGDTVGSRQILLNFPKAGDLVHPMRVNELALADGGEVCPKLPSPQLGIAGHLNLLSRDPCTCDTCSAPVMRDFLPLLQGAPTDPLKQAFIYNLLWRIPHVPDSLVQQAKSTMQGGVNPSSMQRAWGFNLYRSGRTADAFRQILSPAQRGGRTRKMLALLALEQHAPRLAMELMEGEPDPGEALEIRLMAALEIQNWPLARDILSGLPPAGYTGSKARWDDLQARFLPLLSEDQSPSFESLYFRHFNESPQHLYPLLKGIDTVQMQILWRKIRHWHLRRNPDSLKVCLDLFGPLLDSLRVDRNAPCSWIPRALDAGANPFQEWNFLEDLTAGAYRQEQKYDRLSQAIEVNRFSVPLLREYVLVAEDLGLDTYAEPVAQRLRELLDDAEILEFELERSSRRMRREAQWDGDDAIKG